MANPTPDTTARAVFVRNARLRALGAVTPLVGQWEQKAGNWSPDYLGLEIRCSECGVLRRRREDAVASLHALKKAEHIVRRQMRELGCYHAPQTDRLPGVGRQILALEILAG